MTKEAKNLLVFFVAIFGTIGLFFLLGLYTVIAFPILLFSLLYIFRKQK